MIREGKKLPQGVVKRIPDILNAMSRDNDVLALYAFGSLAADALKPLSDLDFGILLSERLKRQQRFAKHLELIGMFNHIFGTDEIDLTLMNDAPPRFSFNIMQSGKLLFVRSKNKLADFQEHVTKNHLDFKHLKEEFDTTFLEGIGYHG